MREKVLLKIRKDLHKDLSGTRSMYVPDKNKANPLNVKECSGVPDKTGSTAGTGVYPAGLLDAASTAVSGLNVSAGQVIADLPPGDYQDFINHPDIARNIAEQVAYSK